MTWLALTLEVGGEEVDKAVPHARGRGVNNLAGGLVHGRELAVIGSAHRLPVDLDKLLGRKILTRLSAGVHSKATSAIVDVTTHLEKHIDTTKGKSDDLEALLHEDTCTDTANSTKRELSERENAPNLRVIRHRVDDSDGWLRPALGHWGREGFGTGTVSSTREDGDSSKAETDGVEVGILDAATGCGGRAVRDDARASATRPEALSETRCDGRRLLSAPGEEVEGACGCAAHWVCSAEEGRKDSRTEGHGG